MELPQSRLSSLYKDFRPLKELNPDGYIANIGTWKEYLKNRYLKGNCLFECGPETLQELSRDIYGIPKSLDVVIDSLLEEGFLVSSEDFYGHKMYSTEYSKFMQWLGIGKRRFLKTRTSEEGFYLKKLQLIVRPSVEEKCKEVADRINENIRDNAAGVMDLVFPLKEFFQKTNFFECVKKEEKDVILFHLATYKKNILLGDNFVKIIDPSLASETLTENDRRIADLKNVLSNIKSQVDKMESERSEYSKMLYISVKERAPKNVQRSYLQARKLAEKHLSRLLVYQTNLQEIKGQIELTITNEVLVSTLSDVNQTMKSIKQYSSSVEEVQDILDELREHRQQADEIGSMLAGTNESIDENELNAELSKMDQQIKKTIEDQEERQDENSDVLNKLAQLKIGGQKSDRDGLNLAEETKNNTEQPVSEY
ncbi:YJL049W [Zygosaccharomyces parabailii]|nr:YJL049W [Zygosaccharomyces parabailii]